MGRRNTSSLTILVADDDADDRLLIKDAFDEAHLVNPVSFVHDGVELIDYLNRNNQFADLAGTPLPGIILLDLNMPRMDGREALKEIKKSPDLRRIPVIILTTSKADEDILQTYDLGASSFISKPVRFEGLVSVIATLKSYWLEIVELPA